MTDTSKRAFPVVCQTNVISQGITLREYYAGVALQGLLASQPTLEGMDPTPKLAIQLADAMIKRLD